MTMDITLEAPRRTAPRTRAPAAANKGASYLVASGQVAVRTLKQFVRTPALIIAGTAQGALFLLIFRYVFGGAVGPHRELSYVDFLVPGFVVTGVLFQGMGASSGVAADLQGGLFDRLRSLPIRLLSIVTGRVGADSVLVAWGAFIMTVIGFAVGFRLGGTVAQGLEAFGLTVAVRVRLRLALHLHGPGGGEPAGGAGAVVPGLPAVVRVLGVRAGVDDAGLDAGLRQQPALTWMINTVRALTGGPEAQALLGHSLSYYLCAGAAVVVGAGRGVRAAGGVEAEEVVVRARAGPTGRGGGCGPLPRPRGVSPANESVAVPFSRGIWANLREARDD